MSSSNSSSKKPVVKPQVKVPNATANEDLEVVKSATPLESPTEPHLVPELESAPEPELAPEPPTKAKKLKVVVPVAKTESVAKTEPAAKSEP